MKVSDIRTRALDVVRQSDLAKEEETRCQARVEQAQDALNRASAALDAAIAQTDEQGKPTGDVAGTQQAYFNARMRLESASRELTAAHEQVRRLEGGMRDLASQAERYVAGEQGNLSKLQQLQRLRFGTNAASAASAIAGRMNIAEETRAMLMDRLGMGGGARRFDAGGAASGGHSAHGGGMHHKGARGAGRSGAHKDSGLSGAAGGAFALPNVNLHGAGKGGYYGGFDLTGYDAASACDALLAEAERVTASTAMSNAEKCARLQELRACCTQIAQRQYTGTSQGAHASQRQAPHLTANSPSCLQAVQQYADRWISGLSAEQRRAINEYTQEAPIAYYKNLNAVLRKKEKRFTNGNRNRAKLLAGAMTNTRIPEDMILFRGVDTDALMGLENLSDAEIAGHTLYDAGFASCSTSCDKAHQHREVMLVIHAPKGTRGAKISALSHYAAGEDEVLLDRRQIFRIVSSYRANDRRYVEVEIIL